MRRKSLILIGFILIFLAGAVSAECSWIDQAAGNCACEDDVVYCWYPFFGYPLLPGDSCCPDADGDGAYACRGGELGWNQDTRTNYCIIDNSLPTAPDCDDGDPVLPYRGPWGHMPACYNHKIGSITFLGTGDQNQTTPTIYNNINLQIAWEGALGRMGAGFNVTVSVLNATDSYNDDVVAADYGFSANLGGAVIRRDYADGMKSNYSINLRPFGGFWGGLDEDIIRTIDKQGYLEFKFNFVDNSFVYRQPMTNCKHVVGDGKIKLAFYRGKMYDAPEDYTYTSPQELINSISNAKSDIDTIQPFKSYKDKFSYYADLKKIETLPNEPSCSNLKANIVIVNSGRYDYTAYAYPNINTIKMTQSALTAGHKTFLHEFGHVFAKLNDEYKYSSQRYEALDMEFTNCKFDPQLFGGYGDGDKYLGCTSDRAYRPSWESLMNHNWKEPRVNLFSCGYILSAILGGAPRWSECMSKYGPDEIIYPGINKCSRDSECFDNEGFTGCYYCSPYNNECKIDTNQRYCFKGKTTTTHRMRGDCFFLLSANVATCTNKRVFCADDSDCLDGYTCVDGSCYQY